MNSLRQTGQSFKKEKNVYISGPWTTEPRLCRLQLDKHVFQKERKKEKECLGKNSSRLRVFCLGYCDPFSHTSTTGKKSSFTSLEMTTKLKALFPEEEESVWERRWKCIAMSANSEKLGEKWIGKSCGFACPCLWSCTYKKLHEEVLQKRELLKDRDLALYTSFAYWETMFIPALYKV